jgi:hypothetical protein
LKEKEKKMTREAFLEYVKCFNTKNYDKIRDYFTDDVKVEYFSDFKKDALTVKTLVGKDAFVANYEALASNFEETLNLGIFLSDEKNAVAEMYTKFIARKDTPAHRAGPMKEGEVFYINQFCVYDMDEAGKFKHIRISHFKVLDPKDAP